MKLKWHVGKTKLTIELNVINDKERKVDRQT